MSIKDKTKKVLKAFSILLLVLVGMRCAFRARIGLPIVHPVYAECFGFKEERIDETGINRVSCYGYIYNIWLE